MNRTSIEWTHRPETGGPKGGFTWNPIRFRGPNGKTGTMCSHASPGCVNCYAEAINKRFGTGQAYNVPNVKSGEFFIDEKILAEPLKRKKPATIFVGDMFDLFHEAIPEELIAEVLTTAGAARQHTFQLLTKRAARMQTFFTTHDTLGEFPPKHFWLGVSVEDQQRADERIPLLLQTPAAIRFLSVEPLLEDVTLEELPSASGIGRFLNCLSSAGVDRGALVPSKIDWVICGGESGPGARHFDLAWAVNIQEQCRRAGIAFFMKQIGSFPTNNEGQYPNPWDKTGRGGLRDRKGGDPAEWPEMLRVREFPRMEREAS